MSFVILVVFLNLGYIHPAGSNLIPRKNIVIQPSPHTGL
jgi:hypothetical protein